VPRPNKKILKIIFLYVIKGLILLPTCPNHKYFIGAFYGECYILSMHRIKPFPPYRPNTCKGVSLNKDPARCG